ncbi:MAG: ATP-binding protein [Rhodoferax sp.]
MNWSTLDPYERSRRLILGGLVVVLVAICGQAWWAVEQDQRQTLAAEAANALVAARLLDEHASQTLQDAVHTLDQVVRTVQRSGRRKPPGAADIRQWVANFDLSHSRHLKALQYVSPDGVSWISSPDYPTHQTVVSYRNDVFFLLSHPSVHEALIGNPYASSYDSQLVLPVSRTLLDANNQSLGVITVDVRLSYFAHLYSRVAQENQASVSLVADQGFVIARSPFLARYLNRDLRTEPDLQRLLGAPVEGSFQAEGFLDDDPGLRLIAYRRNADFPISAVYARELGTVLEPWRQRTRARLALAFATSALALALSRFLLLYVAKLRQSQQQLLQSEHRFAALFQQSPVPAALMRLANGSFLDANHAWLQLFQHDLAQVVGKTGSELHMWADPAQRKDLLQALGRDQFLDRYPVDLLNAHGHRAHCLASARVVSTDTHTVLLFTLVNITALRQAQQELARMNEALEERVRARTATLEQANHDLAQALASVQAMQSELVRSEKMAALGSLVAGVAHELNTPIGNSVTVASTLQYQVDKLRQELTQGSMRRSTLEQFMHAVTHGADILMRSLRRADQLISSFKRVAVDQSSDLRRSFDLPTVLGELCTTLEPMYKKTSHTLELQAGPALAMDSYPGALGQCITNFVSNSLQHGFEGHKQGHMRLTVQPLGETHVRIVYCDDGAGMSAATLRRVFDPFFTTKLGQGGSGLGMNIVYNIVRGVLGGSIHIDSSPGAGTTITLNLPCHAPAPGSTAQDAPAIAPEI